MENFLALQDFSVKGTWRFSVILLVSVIAVPVIAVTVWLFWRRRKLSR